MPLPHSPFVESLLDLLTPLGDVRARRMFGGCGIYRGDLMFGLVDGEAFYLKADDLNRAEFEAQGLEPFTWTDRHGRRLTMSYHRCPETALTSPQRMKRWALLGWQAAERAAARRATPARRTRR